MSVLPSGTFYEKNSSLTKKITGWEILLTHLPNVTHPSVLYQCWTNTVSWTEFNWASKYLKTCSSLYEKWAGNTIANCGQGRLSMFLGSNIFPNNNLHDCFLTAVKSYFLQMCANNLDTYSSETKEVESYIYIASPNKLQKLQFTFKVFNMLYF